MGATTNEISQPDASGHASEPLCLSFTNTVDFHASASPEDGLRTYEDLLRWGRLEGGLGIAQEEALRRAASARPAEAARTLSAAIALREVVYRLFLTGITGQEPSPADLAALNAALGAALGGSGGRRLTVGANSPSIVWVWDEPDLATWPLAPVAWSAAELLATPLQARVGQCADERGCGWLFLDTSRNHNRRWCSMGDCGNRAKQRRLARRLAATRGASAT